MSEQTNIAWCDSTINFWEGCTKVSAGCANCYAEARDKRFTGGKLWGKGAPRRKSKSAVKDALAFNRKPWTCPVCGHAITEEESKGYLGCPNGAEQKKWLAGDRLSPMPPPRVMHVAQHHRRRIFSLSLGDWLDDEVPIEWLAEMLDTIRQCDQVTWILCTKRPENFFALMQTVWRRLATANSDTDEGCKSLRTAAFAQRWETGVGVPAHVILLTSVENQEQADERIPALLNIPAACRGLSLEPLLGPVSLRWPLWHPIDKTPGSQTNEYDGLRKLDWLIIGGESGPNARPCNVEWIRSLVQQGKAAGVATFVKQLGAKPYLPLPESPSDPFSWDNKYNFTDKKGGDPAEWPEDLRVQEWPELSTTDEHG